MKNSKGNDVPPFEKLLNREIVNFRMMGMPSMSGIVTPDKMNTRWWEGAFILITLVTLDSIELFQLNSIIQIYQENLSYAIHLVGLTCSGVLSSIKIIRLWIYRTELFDLLQNLGIMWELARSQNEITEKIAKSAQSTRNMTIYYSVVLSAGIVDHIIVPYIAVLNYELHKDINSSYDFSLLVLPIDYWFTIDTYSTYFICIIHQQLAVLITVIAWLASDNLFAQLTTHISLQLRVLASNLKETIDNSSNDSEMVKKLGDIVVRYQQLYACCHTIEKLFNPIILFTVLSNAMNLCSTAYRLDQELTEGNYSELPKLILYIISVSWQTAVFCIFAEDLSECSALVSEELYQSKWTDCDQKSKTTLMIIMMRAQKEFRCTAYGIIDLNHNQIKQIANTTVSYFMLLRNLS